MHHHVRALKVETWKEQLHASKLVESSLDVSAQAWQQHARCDCMMHVWVVENEQRARSNQQLQDCYAGQEWVALMQCMLHI